MRGAVDPREILRKEIRAARLRSGLTQAEVSARLGRPQSFTSKVEAGERKLEFTEAIQLCEVLGFDPHWLVERVR